jgi:hypothetical protein
MHRRSTWCILGCLRLSNHSPTAGHFVCTGVAFRAFLVLLLTVQLTCPGLLLMHRRKTLRTLGRQPGLWAVNPIQPFSHRGPFFMHRRGASCICVVFVNCAITVLWAIFDAQAQYFVHSGLPTLPNNYPTAGDFLCTGVALRPFWVALHRIPLSSFPYTHFRCFCKLCIYRALGYF